MNRSKRKLIKTVAAVTGHSVMVAAISGLSPAMRASVWAQGSDAPEKPEVKIGFIPLTDCASVVMASVLELDKKYGVKIVLSKEASWSSVRDKLLNGDLDMAHVLYGLVYGLHVGATGPKRDMANLMTLNNNGQAITLSKKLADAGGKDGASLAKLIKTDKREFTFAHTFPTGTHAMWLNYWLASAGIDPIKDVKMVTVAPPQMVANMRTGSMDGFCVGEPWNNRAVVDNVGVTAVTSQAIWKDHPEKILGCQAEYAKKNPNTCRAVVSAVLEASRWIDTNLANKNKMADVLSAPSYVNTSRDVIVDRILGRYNNGMGKTWDDPNAMKFFNDGAVNFPYLSDGMWFLTQQRRWGLIKQDLDYLAVAKEINKTELFKQAATAAKIAQTWPLTRTSTLIDGAKWDGTNPQAYAKSFAIKAA
jgi:nitrate/nitrite transport system substrate-binding protein